MSLQILCLVKITNSCPPVILFNTNNAKSFLQDGMMDFSNAFSKTSFTFVDFVCQQFINFIFQTKKGPKWTGTEKILYQKDFQDEKFGKLRKKYQKWIENKPKMVLKWCGNDARNVPKSPF